MYVHVHVYALVYIYLCSHFRQTLMHGKPKNAVKLHLWAGISRRGPTNLLIFDGIMESKFYCQEILRLTYIPSLNQLYPEPLESGEGIMWADNDPKHNSRLARDTMEVFMFPQLPLYSTS